MATIQYAGIKLEDVDVEVDWGHAVTPEDWPVAQLIDFDKVSGTVTAELTDLGREWVKTISTPRKSVMILDSVSMERIREQAPGFTVGFGGRTYRCYRRNYKLNKLYMKEVV